MSYKMLINEIVNILYQISSKAKG